MKRKSIQFAFVLSLLCFCTAHLLVFCSSQELYVETNSIESVKEYIDDGDTLVVFDLDQTVFETAQALGGDEWFYHALQREQERGVPFEEALQTILTKYTHFQMVVKMQPVESVTSELIKELQEAHTPIISLTTRGYEVIRGTMKHLKGMDIDFSVTAPSCPNCIQDHVFMQKEPIFYHKGILFTAGDNKGLVFEQLLTHTHYLPKKVVFINDKLSPLESLGHACQKLGIDFVGLRYGYLDEKMKNFNMELADIQQEDCERPGLTDVEAMVILNERCSSRDGK
ncbi:DUF2608 domain-containing protein [Simkania negevensis]|uniref:DUF2608 domain-containing protein n=1 Tax=Simkania negevensis TaxID=83561 RepID=A0ABS3ARS3_9BACT|nr:DUF2608 domain-containing protein [Simkania negevensis]